MPQLRLAHSADLDTVTLRTVRMLLEESFQDGFTGEDWEHTLGGVHALAWDDGELIGHASLIRRQLLHAGIPLRTGYVEGLAVRTGRRRRGTGAALMTALEDVVRGTYQLGALSTTEQAAGFYAARGWLAWQGRSYAQTPTGVVRTPDDDDSIFVLPTEVPLDLTGELTCDWRDGDLW